MTDNEMAEEYYYKTYPVTLNFGEEIRKAEVMHIFLAGLKVGKEKDKENCKTAYIKGMRHLANALKEYDRTEGAWTDYFEHIVDKVLKREFEREKIEKIIDETTNQVVKI